MKKFLGGGLIVLLLFAALSNGTIGLNGGEVFIDLPKTGTLVFTKLGEIINIMIADTKKDQNRTPLRKEEKR